ncbi:methylation-associated defense system DNA methyltransferase MAD2 [Bacteroides fragilis]|uniref:methylation-associated defense system DNA methyltransferase MAD2 n=1 Tax=Bacteroides fragilis TaxID=817 RepID=UPI002458CFF2|nr:N-6 DNA methylase [Bacteroides fragilis]
MDTLINEINNTQDGIVVNENELVCSLTNRVVKATEKELALQSMIIMMSDEYNFDMADMERDFKVKYDDPETGKSKTQKVDLAVFESGRAHDTDNLTRIIVVAKDAKVRPSDKKNGVEATIDNILEVTECEFGCWTNGEDLHYRHATEDGYGQVEVEDLSDFPGFDQTLEDLERLGERSVPRKPANESLVRTFKRCHNYLYANEGRKKDAFWELLNLIFCKIYDEKRRFIDAKNGISYRRRFWVGVKEQNTPEGRKAVANRIKMLFEELKESEVFNSVFDGNEVISISDAGVAYIAGELSKYSFLDATVDVKGTAYETIVSNTLKQEAGQFFTPRNIIKCMVQILDPDENTRIADVACGSGGFIVTALDHVRHKIAKRMYSDLDELHLEQKLNSPEVDDAVREYAEKMIFGFDFDPDLKKAARMNMVMAGDGHSNIFNINSLDYPDGSLPDVPAVGEAIYNSIAQSYDKDFSFGNDLFNAIGKFDMIFTNPPFGSKVEVDPAIAAKYELNSRAPEILFIEACFNFLKPGGKVGMVVPDGILGNPANEDVRKWILERFKLIASVDLPVEAFLPQVGVQASLLFMQKKTSEERMIPLDQEDYDVFMAIVEQVGKDRRGVPIYIRDEEGAELLFPVTKKWISYDDKNREVVKTRRERVKKIADDLPMVAAAYVKFKEGIV